MGCRERGFSETRFPVYGILGNSVSGIGDSRKPGGQEGIKESREPYCSSCCWLGCFSYTELARIQFVCSDLPRYYLRQKRKQRGQIVPYEPRSHLGRFFCPGLILEDAYSSDHPDPGIPNAPSNRRRCFGALISAAANSLLDPAALPGGEPYVGGYPTYHQVQEVVRHVYGNQPQQFAIG
jgi:hypothetical protein